jgi:hypothetical protein
MLLLIDKFRLYPSGLLAVSLFLTTVCQNCVGYNALYYTLAKSPDLFQYTLLELFRNDKIPHLLRLRDYTVTVSLTGVLLQSIVVV